MKNHPVTLCSKITAVLLAFLGLQPTVGFAQRVQLLWTPPDSPNISHYDIYRTTHQDSTFVLINSVDGLNRSYVDETIQSNIRYFWAVTATNDTGYESGFSNVVDTTIAETAGMRVVDGQIVVYTFDEGGGSEINDVSGSGIPLNLTIGSGAAINWTPGALAVNSPTIIASAGAATKIIAACTASNEITIEAWIKPATTYQYGPARIISLSADPYARNFTLGHGLTDLEPPASYDVRLRTSATSGNGVPSLTTPDGSLSAQLSHVVYTRDATGVARIYVNNIERASGTVAGDFSTWSGDFRLALANEWSEDRPWLGEFHLLAIFDRALGAAEVGQNFAAGPQNGVVTRVSGREAFSPEKSQLHQNYPNPFNPSTSISYSLSQRSHVSLTIYDINSRQICTLVDALRDAGRHTVTWNGTDAQGTPVSSGTYFYRIRALNSSKFRKMVLVK